MIRGVGSVAVEIEYGGSGHGGVGGDENMVDFLSISAALETVEGGCVLSFGVGDGVAVFELRGDVADGGIGFSSVEVAHENNGLFRIFAVFDALGD